MDPDLAKAIIELVADTRVTVSDAQQSIDEVQRKTIDTLRERREIRTFTSLQVPIGATLTFAKDPAVTCTVVRPRKVLFEGEEMSPSAAALRAVRAIGYDWAAVSGMDYWEYEGTKLCRLGAAPVSELLQDDESPGVQVSVGVDEPASLGAAES
jgi:hypothetical protein